MNLSNDSPVASQEKGNKMLIRIINNNDHTEKRVRVDIVDFDHEKWIITMLDGKVKTYPRKDYTVLIFA